MKKFLISDYYSEFKIRSSKKVQLPRKPDSRIQMKNFAICKNYELHHCETNLDFYFYHLNNFYIIFKYKILNIKSFVLCNNFGLPHKLEVNEVHLMKAH